MSDEPKTHTPSFVFDRYVDGVKQPHQIAAKQVTLDAAMQEAASLSAAFLPTGVQTLVLVPDEGVRVVARDEAAELKAAVKRFLAAIDARDHFIEHEAELLPADWDAAFRRTGDEIAASVAALRRLSGGESKG